MRTILSFLFIALQITFASDQIPAPPQAQPILIQNGTLHTVSQGTLDQYDILFDRGIITRIEKSIVPSSHMQVIEASGKHIYPGLIAGISTLGLVEISDVVATKDFDEVGEMTPEVRANVSYNPDSEKIPVARSSGVLFVNTMPTGGLIAGQSSLMRMDGWTWENATVNHPTAMHINWPDMNINTNPNSKISIEEQEENRRNEVIALNDMMDRVRRYKKIIDNLPVEGVHDMAHDLGLEAMIPYVTGAKPFFVHAYEVRQIEAAVEWSKLQKVKIVILGGWDAGRVTALLKENHIPVILQEVLRLPMRRNSDYSEAYDLPLKLYKAGVSFCISTSGSAFQSAHVRDLPSHAAMAAAFGLPVDEALRSITLSAAEILGVDDRIGSLDVGKEASLFIASGDILEITTQVEQVFINGTTTDMGDKQKTLYHKYREKYRQLGIIGGK
ncbi:MAG: amidohydrolase family protein [Candidatus Marinimicrobia bacterium]|nr:amidohydrolase family protein [Candidatus Neomarinimicrobiota bacterium]